MIGVGNTIWNATLRGGGGATPTELEQIQAAIAAGEVDGGLAASTYALTINGGTPATSAWEATLDGGSPT
jgi:hypothetical protein